jgi:hypothetical protein
MTSNRRTFLAAVAAALVPCPDAPVPNHKAIARAIFERAAHYPGARGIPTGGDQPMGLLAYRAGFDLAVGPEPCAADLVVYEWSSSRALRQHRIARGLAIAWCLRERIPHNELDVDAIRRELEREVEGLRARA